MRHSTSQVDLQEAESPQSPNSTAQSTRSEDCTSTGDDDVNLGACDDVSDDDLLITLDAVSVPSHVAARANANPPSRQSAQWNAGKENCDPSEESDASLNALLAGGVTTKARLDALREITAELPGFLKARKEQTARSACSPICVAPFPYSRRSPNRSPMPRFQTPSWTRKVGTCRPPRPTNLEHSPHFKFLIPQKANTQADCGCCVWATQEGLPRPSAPRAEASHRAPHKINPKKAQCKPREGSQGVGTKKMEKLT